MSFGSTVPSTAILEPIIKAQLEKNPFKNLGALILGYGIDTVLFGMMLVMLVNWWKYAPKESRVIKAVLAYSVFAACVATGYNVHIMIYHFMHNFGKYAPFVFADGTEGLSIIGGLSVSQIQAFYAFRAFRLNNNNWIVFVLICLGSLVQVGASLACFGLRYVTPPLERKDAVSTPIYVWVSASLFADGMITAWIVYGLKKNKTDSSETSRLINKLVTITVEAALPATLISIAFLVTFCQSGNTDLFILFWEMFHPKMYILPFIAVLNSRASLRHGGELTHQSTTGQRSNQTFVLDSLHSASSSAKMEGIHMDTTTERQVHNVIPFGIQGLNRQRKDDESSIGDLTDGQHGGSSHGANDSTTALATPFATYRTGNARADDQPIYR